ncbi:MAG: hypothetical protein HC896_01785 [Bacteroidales bacterium]|nr:hypothetical protein [Bacteroidales bacterium]
MHFYKLQRLIICLTGMDWPLENIVIILIIGLLTLDLCAYYISSNTIRNLLLMLFVPEATISTMLTGCEKYGGKASKACDTFYKDAQNVFYLP